MNSVQEARVSSHRRSVPVVDLSHSSSDSSTAPEGARKDNKCLRLHLYQGLAPGLLARGRAFGSALRFKAAKWTLVDNAYFDAPGEESKPGGGGKPG